MTNVIRPAELLVIDIIRNRIKDEWTDQQIAYFYSEPEYIMKRIRQGHIQVLPILQARRILAKEIYRIKLAKVGLIK